jgi:hypothetical protein
MPAKFRASALRRTGRTGLARLGVPFDIAERVLNHAREKIHAAYDLHEYVEEKREALQAWETYLRRLQDAAKATSHPMTQST